MTNRVFKNKHPLAYRMRMCIFLKKKQASPGIQDAHVYILKKKNKHPLAYRMRMCIFMCTHKSQQ